MLPDTKNLYAWIKEELISASIRNSEEIKSFGDKITVTEKILIKFATKIYKEGFNDGLEQSKANKETGKQEDEEYEIDQWGRKYRKDVPF